MPFFNVLEAKKDGWNDAEIADFLARDNQWNIEQAKKDGWSDKDIIKFLNKTDASPIDTFLQSAKQEVGSEITGAMQLAGVDPTDTGAESLRRQMESENPISGVLGTIAGGLANPSTLIPGSLFFKGVKGLAAGGAIAGGVSGFVQPRYEDEDLSRISSTALGAVAGGALAGGLGKLLDRYGLLKSADELAVETEKAVAKTADEAKVVADTAGVDTTGITKVDTTHEDVIKALDDSIASNSNPNVVSETFDPYNIKLPKDLAGAKPQYGRNVTQFESDLDKALYIVGDKVKLSASDQRYMDWIKTNTGISDENIIRDLGKQVKLHVKNTPDKGNIPSSRLDGLNPVAKITDNIGNQTDAIPVVPQVKDFTVNIPLTPETAAWKTLDNTSKILYNKGRELLEAEFKGVKATEFKFKDPNVRLVIKELKQTMPELKNTELAQALKSYTKTMEDLASVRGDDFKPRSFKDFVTGTGIDESDRIALAKAGFLDGCDL